MNGVNRPLVKPTKRLVSTGHALQSPLREAPQKKNALIGDIALYQAAVLQQMLKYLGPDIEKWWRCNDVRLPGVLC